MRELYFVAGMLLFGFSSLKAQTVLEFTIFQPPLLVANAGADKIILKGTPTTLGGLPTASGGSGTYTYSWSPAEGLSRTDIANPVANPSSTTKYTLTVNDGKKCSITASALVTVNTNLGVEEMAEEVYFQVYPNPNKGSFVIMSEKILGDGKVLIEVFNAAGLLVYSESIPEWSKGNKTITLPNASTGVYLLRLSGNGLNISKTVMVQ